MLDPGDIALLLEELKTEEQQEILTTLGPEKTSRVLNLMSSDEVADLMGN